MQYPVLAVAYADDLDSAFSAGVDNVIRRCVKRLGEVLVSVIVMVM
jgi:hypothetical protein